MSLTEFTGQPFEYVIMVCDAAREACPIFPTRTHRIHWSFEDPAAAGGSFEEAAFRRIRDQLRDRLAVFAAEFS